MFQWRIPPFKTRSVLIDTMVFAKERAYATAVLNVTCWWGLRRRRIKLDVINYEYKRKDSRWHSWSIDDRAHPIVPVFCGSDVHTTLTNTAKDMRGMGMHDYRQLLAHRLMIHMRKTHGKLISASV